MKSRGFLLVLSGPSGAGKNTVLNKAMELDPTLHYSVSATTRPKRLNEYQGEDYFFLTASDFASRIEKGEFLEWADFCGAKYGTPKAFIKKELEEGHVVVMDIDISGARQIKEKMPEAVFVFLLPPTMTELEKRLRGRQSETDEAINQRLRTALEELKAGRDYDYVIMNDEVHKAARTLLAIVEAERAHVERSEYSRLMEEVLENQEGR